MCLAKPYGTVSSTIRFHSNVQPFRFFEMASFERYGATKNKDRKAYSQLLRVSLRTLLCFADFALKWNKVAPRGRFVLAARQNCQTLVPSATANGLSGVFERN